MTTWTRLLVVGLVKAAEKVVAMMGPVVLVVAERVPS